MSGFSNCGDSRLSDAVRLNVEMEKFQHEFFRLLLNTIDGVDTDRLSIFSTLFRWRPTFLFTLDTVR